MKKTLMMMALGGMLALCASPVLLAQDNTTPQQDNSQQQGPGGRGHGMDPDTQLAHMTKQLDLTADQQSQIRPILVDRQQKMQALWQNQSLSQEDRRSQMMGIRQDSNAKIEAVLNDQQKQKFEAMQERRGRHGMQGGDNQPQPQSQPQ
jgi:periplasmic protein CpxP/Spy